MRDLAEIILKNCISEMSAKMGAGFGAAAGAAAGVGAAYLSYRSEKRRLEKLYSECETKECRDNLREKLSTLKEKYVNKGVALGAIVALPLAAATGAAHMPPETKQNLSKGIENVKDAVKDTIQDKANSYRRKKAVNDTIDKINPF